MSLNSSPLSVRIFATMVLLTFGLGYALAIVYLYTKEVRHFVHDGATPVQAVQYAYHGLPSAQPRLLVTLQGSMASTVSAPEFGVIRDWIEAGATEPGYNETVAPIIEKNCISCHAADGYYPPLEGYADVLPLTEADTGIDIAKLARMTHIHLLGIPMVFFIIGALFIRTRYNEVLKALIVILPFGGVLMDIAHWWITKQVPDAAMGVIVGGAVMGVGFGLQWFMTFADIWVPYRQKGAGDGGQIV